MNKTGKEHARELSLRRHSPAEYRFQLRKARILDTLCHCSAEVDNGALQYMAQNGLRLDGGAIRLLLFSAIDHSSPSEDIYGRMAIYELVEEIAEDEFDGLYYCCAQIDGRLTLLLETHAAADGKLLDHCCRSTACRMNQEYGITLTIYVSQPIHELHTVTPIYETLLGTVSLHNYTNKKPKDFVIYGRMRGAPRAAARLPSLQASAQALAAAFVSNDDYCGTAEKELDSFASNRADTVDNLHRLLGDYFEFSCQALGLMGVEVDVPSLRQGLFEAFSQSRHWSQLTSWFYQTLENMHSTYTSSSGIIFSDRYHAALAYIDKHLPETTLTAEDCAASVGCTAHDLGKVFQLRLGSSVSKYIRALRLERAVALLKDGHPVKEVCKQVGFGSAETFHRCFKAAYGLTPGQLSRSSEK